MMIEKMRKMSALSNWLGIAALMSFLVACNAQQSASIQTQHTQKIAEQAGWTENVTVSFENDYLIVRSNGLPKQEILHAYQALSLLDNKTIYVVEPQAMRIRVPIPLQPRLAHEKTPTHIGIIGIAINGALIYSPYDADGRTYALEVNFVVNTIPFIDDCNGHPNPFALQYHYHGIPYCLTKSIDHPGEHSRLLGYLLDGFPIYGPQDTAGKIITPAALDACNGHFGPTPEFPAGIYHYHFTREAPYSIPCYTGEVNLSPSPLALLTRGVDVGAYWLPLLIIFLALFFSAEFIFRRVKILFSRKKLNG